MSLSSASALEVAKAASLSSRSLAVLPTQDRNDALTAIHTALAAAKESILAANAKDLESATKANDDGRLSSSVLKRLDLSRKGKWEDMLQGILDVRDLEDPGMFGHRLGSWETSTDGCASTSPKCCTCARSLTGLRWDAVQGLGDMARWNSWQSDAQNKARRGSRA